MTVRPYIRSGEVDRFTRPDEPGVRVVAVDVFDACGRMLGSIWRVHEREWRITQKWGATWTSEYASKAESLAAVDPPAARQGDIRL